MRKTNNPSVNEVRKYIVKQLEKLKEKGVVEYEIIAGNVVNATPTVCSAMRSCSFEYEEIYSPPKGNTIKI